MSEDLDDDLLEWLSEPAWTFDDERYAEQDGHGKWYGDCEF